MVADANANLRAVPRGTGLADRALNANGAARRGRGVRGPGRRRACFARWTGARDGAGEIGRETGVGRRALFRGEGAHRDAPPMRGCRDNPLPVTTRGHAAWP